MFSLRQYETFASVFISILPYIAITVQFGALWPATMTIDAQPGTSFS